MVQVPWVVDESSLSESMGVEGSGSGLGTEKIAGMEKKEVKESIDVRGRRVRVV